MASTKITGLSGTISVTDATTAYQNIGNDITNYAFTMPRGTEDVTGMNKFAHEQLLLLTDFTVTLNGIFDPGPNLSHSVFSTVSGTSVTRSVSISPTSVTTTPIITVNCLITDYQITRDNTADLTWQVPGQLADGTVPTWA
jgi:hypothetical protein